MEPERQAAGHLLYGWQVRVLRSATGIAARTATAEIVAAAPADT
jgi:hypothetical protein